MSDECRPCDGCEVTAPPSLRLDDPVTVLTPWSWGFTCTLGEWSSIVAAVQFEQSRQPNHGLSDIKRIREVTGLNLRNAKSVRDWLRGEVAR